MSGNYLPNGQHPHYAIAFRNSRCPLPYSPGLWSMGGGRYSGAFLAQNLVGDDPTEHVVRDIPGIRRKGQYGKRQEYEGCD
jgi:hypothetical protein